MSSRLTVQISEDIVIQSATNYVANRRNKIEFNVYKVLTTKTGIVYHSWACCIRAYADALVWSSFDQIERLSKAPYMFSLDTSDCDEVRRSAMKLIPGSH